MMWTLSHRASRRGVQLADRHYNRQSPGSPQFVPPGRCLVLMSDCGHALWTTSWPFAEYVKHEWAGAWVCSLFRREPGCPHLASEMIRAAVAATRDKWGEAPRVRSIALGSAVGMVTFIDATKVRPTMVRGREVFGWTWIKAGFERIGETKGGLLAFGLRPERMPEPEPAVGCQMGLFAHAGR